MKLNLPLLRQGMASLTLVLIVVTLISLIMLPIFLVTYIRNTQAVRFYHSQQAFFAAEGAYAETVGRIKNFPGWVTDGNVVSDSYNIPPNTITRLVSNHSGTYDITITANNRLAQRKIEGAFTPAGTTTSSYVYDVVAVLDYSRSMLGCIYTDPSKCEEDSLSYPTSPDHWPISQLRKAIKDDFIPTLKANNPDNSLGIVIFHSCADIADIKPLSTPGHDTYLSNFVEKKIKKDGSWTNLGLGIQEGIKLLNGIPDDPVRKKVIILFSDGGPTRTFSDNAICKTKISSVPTPDEPEHSNFCNYSDFCDCQPIKCATPNTSQILEPFTPSQKFPPTYDEKFTGSFCTHEVITQADTARINDGIDFFSIYYANSGGTTTCSPAMYDETTLGKWTTFFISNDGVSTGHDPYVFDDSYNYNYFFSTTNPANFATLFSNIIDSITTGGSTTYSEAVPD